MVAKHLFLVHGRDFKPGADFLREQWLAALAHGMERDHPDATLEQYRESEKTFVYFGDLSNGFLRRAGRHYNETDDQSSRDVALSALKEYATEDFLDKRGREIYEGLDGKSSVTEFLADLFANPLHFIGASESVISLVAPDMQHYWNPDRAFGSDLRWRLTEPLAAALGRGDDVMLMAHSLGSIMSYDVLWKLSYYGEWRHIRNRTVSEFVSLGSPLGNATVRGNLKGGGGQGLRRYPTNIGNWHNVAAEDDYIAQDETVADDFEDMESARMVNSIRDHRIYNLAVRDGESNPHHATGYLVHPEVVELVADWLTRDAT